MSVSIYDQMGDFYYNFIQQAQKDPMSLLNLTIETVLSQLGDVQGKFICDLACGEGYLSRILAQRGAYVTGIDLSSNLLDHAHSQSEGYSITYILDDAQSLTRLNSDSFDFVVSNLALMDIPQLQSTFVATNRVLKDTGIFVFSVLHPCFETPFSVPANIAEFDDGNFVACRVMRYLEEGKWNSGGTGMRGTHGAYHRKLSTYINLLIESGFELKSLSEPTLPSGDYNDPNKQWGSRIPRTLVVKSIKKVY